ncbi:MAG: DUF6531 domain-containing protein [Pseudomonadota bacterium]
MVNIAVYDVLLRNVLTELKRSVARIEEGMPFDIELAPICRIKAHLRLYAIDLSERTHTVEIPSYRARLIRLLGWPIYYSTVLTDLQKLRDQWPELVEGKTPPLRPHSRNGMLFCGNAGPVSGPRRRSLCLNWLAMNPVRLNNKNFPPARMTRSPILLACLFLAAILLAAASTDTNGQQTTTGITVEITRDLKIGQFSLSFLDLEVSAVGIPIRVTRTYDTRRKSEALDFGHGWSVDYQHASAHGYIVANMIDTNIS